MNNSTGYIRLWEPFFQTGTIFGCDGEANGKPAAFRFANVNDHDLQQRLASSPGFGPLDTDCDNLPPGAIPVSFEFDGNGFALNVMPM